MVKKTLYVCPDCGWRLETVAHRIRCGDCGSLNLERQLPDGRLIKADLNYEWISDLYGDQQKGIEFRCPQCGELLFTDYEEAEDFLKQKPAKP